MIVRKSHKQVIAEKRTSEGWPEWLVIRHESKTVRAIASLIIDEAIYDKNELKEHLEFICSLCGNGRQNTRVLEIPDFLIERMPSYAAFNGLSRRSLYRILNEDFDISTMPKAASLHRKCISCGIDFIGHTPYQQLCGNECSECRHCGKMFAPKKIEHRTYCSRECAFDASKGKIYIDGNMVDSQGSKRKRVSDSKIISRMGPQPPCPVCGDESSSLSDLCGKQSCYTIRKKHRGNYSRERACKICGRKWLTTYGDKRRDLCSDKCSSIHANKNRIPGGFNTRGKRVVQLMYGLYWNEHYQWINTKKVHELFKWRCQLCGCKVKKYKTYNDRQASVDHIVPLSIGGDHKYHNMQTLCMKCNSDKGADTRGQLCMDI